MSHDWMNLDELAQHLGRDRREIEKLVNRGRIPGRKIAGEWQFHHSEIAQWLEQEMRGYSDSELANVEQSQQMSGSLAESPLRNLLHLETMAVPLEARTKRSVLEALIEIAGRTWQIWEPAAILNAVQEREELLTTAFDNGVAIPHPRNPMPDALGEPIIAYGRTLSGIPFGGAGRTLTDIFFLVLCKDSATHLRVLARLGRLIQMPEFLTNLRAAEDAAASYDLITQMDASLDPGT